MVAGYGLYSLSGGIQRGVPVHSPHEPAAAKSESERGGKRERKGRSGKVKGRKEGKGERKERKKGEEFRANEAERNEIPNLRKAIEGGGRREAGTTPNDSERPSLSSAC